MIYTYSRSEIVKRIEVELENAYKKHGKENWKRHEFYGILKEEFRELENEIFKGGDQPFDIDNLIKEILHVTAVCFRFLETGI